MKIKTLIAAACLAGVATLTFAQATDTSKPAPITNNWSPSYANAPENGVATKPYAANEAPPAKHVKAKKTKKAQKAKPTKAKKASHSKTKKTKHKKTKTTKHHKAKKTAAAGN